MSLLCGIYVLKSLWSDKRYTWQLITFSALAMLGGLPSALYVVLGLVYMSFFTRPVRKMSHPVACCAAGFVAGLVLTLLYMWCFGQVRTFIVNTMNGSAVILKIWDVVKGIVYPILGKTVTPTGLPAPVEGVTFTSTLLSIFSWSGAAVIASANVVLLAVSLVWRNIREYRVSLSLFLFALFVILSYTLSGRFMHYYMWTAVLPMILSLLVLMNGRNRLANTAVGGIAAVAVLALTWSNWSVSGETPCDRIEVFVRRQHFHKTDRVATEFSTFFAVKPILRHAYFYQVYPLDMIGEVDYVIISEQDGVYNKAGMLCFLNSLRDNPLYEVRKVDAMNNPELALYKVVRKKRTE